MRASVQIIRNVLANWGSTFMGMVVGFLMMPFLVHQLGDAKYGIWVLIINFTGYLGLLDFGVGGSVVKYVAEFKARNDKEGLNEICSTAFYFYLAAGILAFLFAAIVAFYLIPAFKIPPELLSEAKYVTLIVGFYVASSLPLGFFSGYMRGMQRYDMIAYISMAVLLIRTLAIVVFVFMGYGLIALALVHLVSTLLGGLIKIIYVYSADRDLKLKLEFFSRKRAKIVSHYSLFVFLFYLAIRLIFAMDSLIIGYYLGAVAITFYSIAHRLIEYIRLFIMSMGVLQPTVSHLEARNQTEKIQYLLRTGTKYGLMISLPLGVSYILVGREFLSLWMGAKYASMSYPVLVVLTAGIISHISQHTSIQVLQGLAKHKIAAYAAMFQAAASIVLSIFLVEKYGIVGVAIGKTIPMIFINLMLIPWYTCWLLGLAPLSLLKEAFIPPLVSAFVFSMVLYFFSQFLTISTWTSFVVVLFMALSVYVLCAWLICLSKAERRARFQQFRAVFNFAS